MTYPLASFSYSFQRRMRELALPFEAYNLQVADIDETLHFKPLLLQSGSIITRPLCFSLKRGFYATFEPKIEITEHTLVQPKKIYFVSSEWNHFDIAYDALLTALPQLLLIGRTHLIEFRFIACIIDARILRYFQRFNSPNHLTIKFRRCLIWKNVNINMVSGFDLILKDCGIQKSFFNGITEFFNKTATTQNVRIDQSVYGITQLLDLNIVDVYGFKTATDNVNGNNKLLLSRYEYAVECSKTVLYQVFLKNSPLPEYRDCLRPRFHWQGKKWISRIVNWFRFSWCQYYLSPGITPDMMIKPFLFRDRKFPTLYNFTNSN